MKKSKKQSWIKTILTDGLFWSIFLVIVALIVAYHYFTSTSYICSINPERCVSEPNKDFTRNKNEWCNKYPKSNFCHLRLKTQAELDIDDCKKANWFVGDSKENKCQCEEWLNSSDNWHSRTPIQIFNEIYPFIGKYRNYKFEDCNFDIPPESSKNYSEWLNTNNGLTCSKYSICIKSRPKTSCDRFLESEQCKNANASRGELCMCGNIFGSGISGINISNLEITFQSKTPCQKGNLDWVEEIICVKCEQSGSIPQQIMINDEIIKTSIEWYVNQSFSCFCTESKSICREKTREEKEVDFSRDCGWTEKGFKVKKKE